MKSERLVGREDSLIEVIKLQAMINIWDIRTVLSTFSEFVSFNKRKADVSERNTLGQLWLIGGDYDNPIILNLLRLITEIVGK